MSKENLDSYELFFAEIPKKYDYLSEIIRNDNAHSSHGPVSPPDKVQGLSPEQVKRLADDSRKLRGESPNPPADDADSLFS